MDKSLETYFQRQLILPEMDEGGILKLRSAKVLVVGAGGLGCPVLEQLSGSGVGTIGIVDNDLVGYSNLHRQSLYTEDEIGEYKVFCASRRLLKRNPHCNINVYPQLMRKENALQIINGYDVVIDCTDNYSTRYLINDACVLLNKPFVFGAIYRFQGQVAIFNDAGVTYRCYAPEFPASESATDCVNSGVISLIPSLVGNLQALEAIKWILGEQTLKNEMLLIDFKKLSFDKIALGVRRTDYSFLDKGLDHPYYEMDCAVTNELDHDELKNMISAGAIDRLIDVRELEEVEDVDAAIVEIIPLSKLKSEDITIEGNVLFFCKSGKRSREATRHISGSNGMIYSLKGEMTNELLELWKNRK